MGIRKKLPVALLTGLTVGLTFFLFGLIDIYCGNIDELAFSYWDFGVATTIFGIFVATVVTLALLFTNGKIHNIIFGVVLWIVVMSYVQGAFMNAGSTSLMNDEGVRAIKWGYMIVNSLIWIFTGAGFVFVSLKMEKITITKSISVILLLMVLGMQCTTCTVEILNAAESQQEQKESGATKETKTFLTEEGLYEVSSQKNVIIFLLDRFDVSFVEDLQKKDENFFEPLTGFTYFNDNIALYSRTYPAVATMITGVDNDFTTSTEEYFKKAYGESEFLKDLKDNDYKVKIYTTTYYGYRDGNALKGIAENVSSSTGYAIKNPSRLIKCMMGLVAYKYLPYALKATVNMSTESFTGLVSYSGDADLYELNDAKVYQGLRENGLTIDEDSENGYTFIHLNGCHPPYKMNAEGKQVSSTSSLEASTGCFRMIYEYIDELKRLGLYENATIIITGDHASPDINENKVPETPRLTALFVKPAGNTTEAFTCSNAQVSQENLIPTIVKSCGLNVENGKYGKTYFDIVPGENTVRHHKFELNMLSPNYIVDIEITGSGNDMKNWKEISRKDIGYLYD